jgi:hypothetical protein
VRAMTLDEWIEELRYGDLDSIKDRLDAIEILEFLEELKKRRKSEQSIYDNLQAELFDNSKGYLDYKAGYDDVIKKAIDILKRERGEDDT